MAGLAWLPECPFVRVVVAGSAIGERQVPELDIGLRILDFQMTLLTFHFYVRSAENIARPFVIELPRILPAQGVVAVSAILGKLPAVLVLVAIAAFRRQSQPCPVQILHHDSLGTVGIHARWLVTGSAGERCMFSFQRITGPTMIEFRDRCVPAHQREILAVVFGMAIGAYMPRPVSPDQGWMEPSPLVQPAADFLMAIQTFKGWRSFGQVVALGAIRRTVQEVVRR